MLMMLPRHALTISASTARVIRIGARTFTLKISSHVSSLTLKGSANVINPALFTRTSTRPPNPSAASTIRSGASSAATSVATATARRPIARTLPAASSRRFAFRLTRTRPDPL